MRTVMRPVEKHISQRGAGLARRGERACVVAIGEHATGAAYEAIESARDADLERTKPARERVLVLGFDDEVQVGVLEREVNDAKIRAALVRFEERRLHGAQLELRPERRELPRHPERRVDGMIRDVHGPRTMRHARALGARSARTFAGTTPTRVIGMRTTRGEREL